MVAMLWKLLLGSHEGPEIKGDRDIHPLRQLLLERIRSHDDSVVLATLGIVGAMIEVHDEELTDNLFLRNIPVRALSKFQTTWNSKSSIATLRQLASSVEEQTPQVAEDRDFLLRLHDAQLAVFQVFQQTDHWKYETQQERDPPFEGSLLQQLLLRMEGMLDNSEIVNFSLTETFLKIIRLPHPAIYPYFLNAKQGYPSSVGTLPKALQLVSAKILRQREKVQAYAPKLLTVRQQNRQPDHLSKYYSSDGGILPEERRLLNNVVVFEEFCHELAALAHAKTVQLALFVTETS